MGLTSSGDDHLLRGVELKRLASATERATANPDQGRWARYVTPGWLKTQLEKINPDGCTENCGWCAIATDKMLAGERPTKPVKETGLITLRSIERCFPGKEWLHELTAQDVQEVLARPKARAIVFGHAGDSGSGHFFNGFNDKGDVRYVCGQTVRHVDPNGFEHGKLSVLVTEEGDSNAD